jgi:hypothetical protein
MTPAGTLVADPTPNPCPPHKGEGVVNVALLFGHDDADYSRR